jgi:hypothetical protein
VEVRVVSVGNLACPRCGREPYLQAAVPDPDAVNGHTNVVLCPICDAGTPSAQPLLAWFAAHDTVSEDRLDEFADLVRAWLDDITPARLSDGEIAAILRHWAG